MRKGTASCRGAITIMNAIPTGVGSAMGISLQTDAEVTIDDGPPGIAVQLSEPGEDDALAKECVNGVFGLAGKELIRVEVRTSSSIPISRGLKSSSAAANAIILATAKALDFRVDDLDAVKLGVEAAKRARVTVTGAFDDASACYFGGIVVTDNARMHIMKLDSLAQEDLRVVLYVPSRKIRKSGISRETFEPVMSEFGEVMDLVMAGRYLEAMILNGKLCSSALGLETDAADRAVRAGAVAAGLSGTGPATAILCRPAGLMAVLKEFQEDSAALIVSTLNSVKAPEVVPCL